MGEFHHPVVWPIGLSHDDTTPEHIHSGSKTPDAVHSAAALLATIDEEWCHFELVAAIESMDDVSNRRRLVAALARSSSELVRQRAQTLQPAAPERAPEQIGYTYDEVVAANLSQELESKVDAVKNDVEKLNLREIAETWETENRRNTAMVNDKSASTLLRRLVKTFTKLKR